MMTKFILPNMTAVEAMVNAIRIMGFDTPLVADVTKKKERKTMSQTGLYHWWIDIIGKDQGNFHDDQGQILMKHFIPPTHQTTGINKVKKDAWSSTELDKPQMSALMTMIDIWAQGEGIFLPRPEDAHRRY